MRNNNTISCINGARRLALMAAKPVSVYDDNAVTENVICGEVA